MDNDGKLLGITKAARILGVHPLTLRSWADQGHIPFYRTPGGHRRFRQSDLADFLRQMSQGGGQTSALVTMAHQAVRQAIATLPQYPSPGLALAWRDDMTGKQIDTMRAIGRNLLGLVIQYAAGKADGAILNRGRQIGMIYGRFAREKKMSVSETIATFNFFRDAIIEVTFEAPANVAGLETSNPQLYRRLNHFMNEVLLATVQAVEGREPEAELLE